MLERNNLAIRFGNATASSLLTPIGDTNIALRHNLTEAFSMCDYISPEKFDKFCYEGMGRMLQSVAYRYTEQAVAACFYGNQPTYYDDCLIGALKTLLKGDAKQMLHSSSADFQGQILRQNVTKL